MSTSQAQWMPREAAPPLPMEDWVRFSEDDVRDVLRAEMEKAGGLRKWADLNDIPRSWVSEFETGRRDASLTILVALGFTRAIVRALPARAAIAKATGAGA